MSETAEGRLGRRLRRILLLLPYAIQHPGVGVGELARKFGVKKKDLIEDLNLVFLCGLPGYGPGDLIDATIDDDRVYVRMADYFASPLRLTPTEALALYAGAGALTTLSDMDQADALKRAVEKLGRALGSGGNGSSPNLKIELETGAATHLRVLQEALDRQQRVRLDYFSGSRGEMTSRTVEPWGLVAALGRWYLVAWDTTIEDERMFRADRIKHVTALEETATIPDDFDPERYRGAFVERSDEALVRFEISPAAARWFTDYYPVRDTEALDDGWMRVELATSGERWPALLILRLGQDVRAVDPPAVMEAAREIARAIAARHGCVTEERAD